MINLYRDGKKVASMAYVTLVKLAVPATFLLPVVGLLFCVLYSILYNFEETNSTHCEVRTYNLTRMMSIITVLLNVKMW